MAREMLKGMQWEVNPDAQYPDNANDNAQRESEDQSEQGSSNNKPEDWTTWTDTNSEQEPEDNSIDFKIHVDELRIAIKE